LALKKFNHHKTGKKKRPGHHCPDRFVSNPDYKTRSFQLHRP
jgi:hypothetical protein